MIVDDTKKYDIDESESFLFMNFWWNICNRDKEQCFLLCKGEGFPRFPDFSQNLFEASYFLENEIKKNAKGRIRLLCQNL